MLKEEALFYAFDMGKNINTGEKRLGNIENLRKMKFPSTFIHLPAS